MKLVYTTGDGRLSVELEADTQKELFRQLSRFQEVFEETASATIDGSKVTSTDIRYRVRSSGYTDEKGKDKTAEYFEKVVVSGPLTGWKKAYGTLDDGSQGLFPKWKVDDANCDVGDNGWHKYNKPQ
jgi:hypothetical protein